MYRREAFHDKEIMIPYDATFKRMDDNNMKSQYIGKNMTEPTSMPVGLLAIWIILHFQIVMWMAEHKITREFI